MLHIVVAMHHTNLTYKTVSLEVLAWTANRHMHNFNIKYLILSRKAANESLWNV
jgi:hypothetical protein